MLIIFVIPWTRRSIHDISRGVGIGLRQRDVAFEFIMSMCMSASVSGLKESNHGGSPIVVSLSNISSIAIEILSSLS